MPKVAVTVLFIVGCAITAVVVAALANCCCEKKEIKDDISDISDNTKKLIKARLAIIQMQRRRELQKSTLKIFRLWSKKSKSPRASPNPSTSRSNEQSVVVDLEEDNDSGGSVANSSSKSTFLKGNKVANGGRDITPSNAPNSPKLSASVFSSKKGANSSKASSPASSIKSYASSFVSSSTESKRDMTSSSTSPRSASSKSTPEKSSSVAANTKVQKPQQATNKKKSVTFNEKVEIQQTE
ncbi:hypothetical protein FSP39_011158 [Pinctada imbricata]|uniref:Uncharacterized protein n=1 Tax=Pinctada imbricata TaxID=66713 RepID=A0AA88XIG5_PINIB|nr:hypothetical protein FSP39_011158 [Pinctada imbricata]